VPPKKRLQATKQKITDERLKNAIDKIKAGEFSVERLLEQFVLTEEQDKMLSEGLA
jgi:DNA-binding transcriptional regulator YhcF (GntR family)